MKHHLLVIFFIYITLFTKAQTLQIGSKAPSFVLNTANAGMQGFSMPYMNRVVLIHFYNTSVSRSKTYNKNLNRLAQRYKNAIYRNCEGFEVITIAVQSDKKVWTEGLLTDTLNQTINAIALKGYNDDVCLKFGVNSLPADFLIDEKGEILAINPSLSVIEDILDSKKNFQPIKKDISGTLSYANNKTEYFKYSSIYLFNKYGDSLSKTITDDFGKFTFNEIKLYQDFYLKVDNGVEINLSDPLALYNYKGEKLMNSRTAENGFIFYIPSKMSYRLIDGLDDAIMEGKIDQIDVDKRLVFKPGGNELTPKDESDVQNIVDVLTKNTQLDIEIIGHTSTKLDPKSAQTLAKKHANAFKNYLMKKGIDGKRIKTSARGNSSPFNECKAQQPCSNEDHAMNQRLELRIYKN
jgi:outer membrane protein OmpA-like peptidoglycan-associated protein